MHSRNTFEGRFKKLDKKNFFSAYFLPESAMDELQKLMRINRGMGLKYAGLGFCYCMLL